MQKLLTGLEKASVERFRADRDPSTGQSTFDKGRLLVMNAIKAYASPKSTTTTARCVACYVHGTLGWRNRHLYTQDEEKQKRVRVFGDPEALAAIFLDLVKKGALDAEGWRRGGERQEGRGRRQKEKMRREKEIECTCA